jgi:hypothetical protein
MFGDSFYTPGAAQMPNSTQRATPRESHDRVHTEYPRAERFYAQRQSPESRTLHKHAQHTTRNRRIN